MKIFNYFQFVLVLFFHFKSEAQIKNKVTKYADLHAHTVIKHYYNSENTLEELMTDTSSQAYKLNELQYKNGKVDFTSKKNKNGSSIFNTYYQINNAEYESLKGSILVESLTPLEFSTFNTSLKVYVGNFISGINISKLKIVGKGFNTYKHKTKKGSSQIPSFTYSQFKDLAGQNLFFLKANSNQEKYRILKWDEEIEALIKENPNQIILTTSIEGGHCFQDSLAANIYEKLYVEKILNNPNVEKYKLEVKKEKIKHDSIRIANKFTYNYMQMPKLLNTSRVAAEIEVRNIILEDEAISKELIGLKWRVDSVKKFPNRVLFVTIGHHSYNGMLAQAGALDQHGKTLKGIIKKAYENPYFQKQIFYKGDKSFFPEYIEHHPIKIQDSNIYKYNTFYGTSGFNLFGDSLIEYLLDNSTNKRVLIDIKHMSFPARINFYTYLEKKSIEEKKPIPIIASHCAASGKSYSYFDKSGCSDLDKNTCDTYCSTTDKSNHTYYPWSINLFDEEIEFIYKSKGIIGVPFEERMIGAYQYKYKDDRKNTIKTYEKIFRNNSTIYNSYVKDFLYIRKNCMLPFFSEKQKKEITSTTFEMAELYVELEPFLNNVFYMASKSGEIPKNAFDRICIGSDYDGNIDPIDICPTARYMPDFENYLKLFIKIYPLVHTEYKDLYSPFINHSDELVEKIMYSNLKNFLCQITKKEN